MKDAKLRDVAMVAASSAMHAAAEYAVDCKKDTVDAVSQTEGEGDEEQRAWEEACINAPRVFMW